MAFKLAARFADFPCHTLAFTFMFRHSLGGVSLSPNNRRHIAMTIPVTERAPGGIIAEFGNGTDAADFVRIKGGVTRFTVTPGINLLFAVRPLIPMYRCASPNCPGYPWQASQSPHPASCASPVVESPVCSLECRTQHVAACRAHSSDGWWCTRVKGHDGMHAACGSKHALHSWGDY